MMRPIYPLDTHCVSSVNLSDDILQGAGQIAEFIFGDKTERRRVYHLAESRQLPVFRMGATLCARRSTVLAWIAEQEQGRASGREAA